MESVEDIVVQNEGIYQKERRENNVSENITFIRFIVCLTLLFMLMYIKNNNTVFYENIRNIYIKENSIEILDKDTLINYIHSWGVASIDFFKTCILEIFRSVTS